MEQTQRIGFGTRLLAYLIDTVIIFILEWPLTFLLAFIGFGAGSAIGAGAGSMQAEPGAAVVGGIFGAIFGSIGFTLVGMVGFVALYFATEIFTGYTLGKYLLGIQIYDENKIKPSLKASLIRFSLKSSYFILITLSFVFLFIAPVLYLVFSTAALLIGTVFTLGYFAALGAKKQALHDILSKTAVYRRKE